MPDDAELLRAFAESRSEAAFAELVRRHLNLVYFAALRRCGGDAHQAADIAQQVFATLAVEANALSRHPTLVGWLHTATRFAAARMRRDEHRRRMREQEAAMREETASDPDLDWTRVRAALDDVVDELNARDREAVLLRFFEGQPFARVGETLKLTENAARMRVERALEKLRERLARRGITSTAAALGALLTSEAGATAPAGLAVSITSTAMTGGVSGAGGLAGAKVITFMSTSKIALGVAGIVAVAATTLLVRQQQSMAQIRAEMAALREENAGAARLRSENQRLADAQSTLQASTAAEHAELEKLRAEKRAFQQQLAAKAARPARESAGDPGSGTGPTLAPGMVSAGLMANVGRATPSAAAQTMVWASQHGDIDGAAGVITFDPEERAKMDAFIATLPPSVRAEYGTPERMIAFVMSGSPKPIAGVQLLSRTQPDDATEIHRVQVQFQSGEMRQDELKFRRDDGGWKQVISPALVDRVIGYVKAKG